MQQSLRTGGEGGRKPSQDRRDGIEQSLIFAFEVLAEVTIKGSAKLRVVSEAW